MGTRVAPHDVKEIPMHPLITVFTLLLLTLPAAAEKSPRAIDLTNVPQKCHPLSIFPSSATSVGPELSARVSVANCMATEMLRAIPLADDHASLQALNAAALPSLQMYDDVIARGDAAMQIIAQHAKADLLLGLQTRMRNTIPSLGADGTVLASAPQRREALEPLLEPWRSTARAAFDEIALLSDANPQLEERNPVVAYVVSRIELDSPGTAVARP
jgi:hypothetical protein